MFILASASPRRRALLAGAGLHFEVRAPHIDEAPHLGELPRAYVRRVARAKAGAVVGEVVLAADTTVDLDGEILGKPASADEAVGMIQRLAGRGHRVHTGVALRVGSRTHTLVCTTPVSFRPLTHAEILTYVATGDPLDKAGAYGIQSAGGAVVDVVRGSYTNVMGLPLREPVELLRRFGVE